MTSGSAHRFATSCPQERLDRPLRTLPSGPGKRKSSTFPFAEVVPHLAVPISPAFNKRRKFTRHRRHSKCYRLQHRHNEVLRCRLTNHDDNAVGLDLNTTLNAGGYHGLDRARGRPSWFSGVSCGLKTRLALLRIGRRARTRKNVVLGNRASSRPCKAGSVKSRPVAQRRPVGAPTVAVGATKLGSIWTGLKGCAWTPPMALPCRARLADHLVA